MKNPVNVTPQLLKAVEFDLGPIMGFEGKVKAVPASMGDQLECGFIMVIFMSTTHELKTHGLAKLPFGRLTCDRAVDNALPIERSGEAAQRDGEFAPKSDVDGSIDVRIVDLPAFGVEANAPAFALSLPALRVGLRCVGGRNQAHRHSSVHGLVGQNPSQFKQGNLRDGTFVLPLVLLGFDAREVLQGDAIGIALEDGIGHQVRLVAIYVPLLALQFAKVLSCALCPFGLKTSFEVAQLPLLLVELFVNYEASIATRRYAADA